MDQPQANLRLLLTTAAICALFASLLSSSVGQAHLLFRLSLDGLLPACLSNTLSCSSSTALSSSNVRFTGHSVQLPMLCYSVAAVLSTLIAYALPISSLLRMLGVGTLFNCFTVAVSLLWLRFDLPEQLPLEQSQQPLSDSGNECCSCCCSNPNHSNHIEASYDSCSSIGAVNSYCDCCYNPTRNHNLHHRNHHHHHSHSPIQKMQPVVALQGSYYFERHHGRSASNRGPVTRSLSDCVLQHQGDRTTTTITTRARNYGACAVGHHELGTQSAPNPPGPYFGSFDSFGRLRPEVDGYSKYVNHHQRTRSVCVSYERQSFVSLLGFDFTLNHQLPTSRSARKVKRMNHFFQTL